MSLSWAIVTAPAIATTGYSAVCAAAYLASKRTIYRKMALVALISAAVLWVPAALVGVGAMPLPPVGRNNLN